MKAYEVTSLRQSGTSNKTLKKYVVIAKSTPRALMAVREKKYKNEEVIKAIEMDCEVIIDGNYHN